MDQLDAMTCIRETQSLVFTTREFSMLGNLSMTFASQMLRRLAAKGRVVRLFQGLWADVHSPQFNAFKVVPFLTRPHPSAVSLLSALHLHGMIEQIPQTIYVVSTAPTRRIQTPVGTYSLHQIAPSLFDGYEDPSHQGFLVATPEKALVDCLYLSVRKGQRFTTLPELSLPQEWNQRLTFSWIKRIGDPRLQKAVQSRLKELVGKK